MEKKECDKCRKLTESLWREHISEPFNINWKWGEENGLCWDCFREEIPSAKTPPGMKEELNFKSNDKN